MLNHPLILMESIFFRFKNLSVHNEKSFVQPKRLKFYCALNLVSILFFWNTDGQ